MSRGSESRADGRVEVRHVIAASPERVFDAWTDAESMTRWMRPGPGMQCRCRLDVRVGGSFEIDMIAPDGTTLPHTGTYRVVDRPRKLVFTWMSGPTNHRETIVTVEFQEANGGTEIVLTHEGLPVSAAKPHEGGWQEIIRNLADAVANTARSPSAGRSS
ncbi:MAG TPA: SRPBCC domain-containing protein [Gemmatimonadaceae bacterium]|nr:SRPBCC domain-containing protein [Gemmatimonadaceae bacterium]